MRLIPLAISSSFARVVGWRGPPGVDPRAALVLSVDREALLGSVVDERGLPGIQAGAEIAVGSDRGPEGLVEVRVRELHEGQPLPVGVDRLGDAGEQLIDLLPAVEGRLV